MDRSMMRISKVAGLKSAKIKKCENQKELIFGTVCIFNYVIKWKGTIKRNNSKWKNLQELELAAVQPDLSLDYFF